MLSSSLSPGLSFFYSFIIALNESCGKLTKVTQDCLPDLQRERETGRQETRGTRREMFANDCGSMSQMKKNGCMALRSSSYLWAFKQVRNTIDIPLSWVFTHHRGHQRQREAKVIYMFYHSNDRTRAFSSRFNSLRFFIFLLYRDCALCAYINFVVLACSSW